MKPPTCTMWILFCFVVALVQGFPFLTTTLNDCPDIPAQDQIPLREVLGSWRLAYLFLDDPENLEEDDSCVVTEISQVNDTLLDLVVYIDSRKSDHVLERSTMQFQVTLLTRGEWLLHTPLAEQELIHATVVSLSDEAMILTFCGTQPDRQQVETGIGNVDGFERRRSARADEIPSHYLLHSETNLGEGDSRPGRGSHRSRLAKREKRSFLREPEESQSNTGSYLSALGKYIDENPRPRSEKHLWTAVLVKHNDVSALKFVELATVLLKYGYDLSGGQLVSFAKCQVARK